MTKNEVYQEVAVALHKCLGSRDKTKTENNTINKKEYEKSLATFIDSLVKLVEFSSTPKKDNSPDLMELYQRIIAGAAPNAQSQVVTESKQENSTVKSNDVNANIDQMARELPPDKFIEKLTEMDFSEYIS